MAIEDKAKRTYGRRGQHNVLLFSGPNGKHEHYWYNSNTGQMGWHGDMVDPKLKRAAGQDAVRNARSISESRRHGMQRHMRLDPAVDQKGTSESKELQAQELRMEKHSLRLQKVQALGVKFHQDKRALEKRIAELEAKNNPDYADAIKALETQLSELQEEFEHNVAEVAEQLGEQLDEMLEEAQETQEEIEEEAEELRETQMEASSTDSSAAADALDKKKQEFQATRTEYATKLKLLREQQADLQRKMRAKRLRGEP